MPKAEGVPEIVRIDISETTESRAVEGGQTKQRVYSLRATKFGQWLLLFLIVVGLFWGANGLTGFKSIFQKMM